jgi:MBG domain (YGX type)
MLGLAAPLLVAWSWSLGTASSALADSCFTGGPASGSPYTVPASGVTTVRLFVNGQVGQGWNGLDASGNVLAKTAGGLGSALVVDVPVTPGEVLQAGYLAGAPGGASPDVSTYYQFGLNGMYNQTNPGGTGGGAEYVTSSVNGGCPHAVAVAAGGGGAGAIIAGGAGGNASWGSTGATAGGDGGSNNAVDGGGGGGGTSTGGGTGGAYGHSANACHDGSSGTAGGFLSGGNGADGSGSVVDAQLNVYCNGGGGAGGGGAGYYYGGGGGSGYDDYPSGGGGGGESYVAPGATVISQGALSRDSYGLYPGGATTPAPPSVVPHNDTSVTLSSSTNPVPKADGFTLTATVNTLGTGSDTSTASGGTVTLYNNITGSVLASAQPVVNGQATFTIPGGVLGAGTWPIYADYSGYTSAGEIDLAEYSPVFDQTIQQTLTVTPDNQTIAYGQGDPNFTYSVSGAFPGDSNLFDTTPTCGVAGMHTAVGTYDITCSGGIANSAYVLDETAKGTLTITKADQAISFSSHPLTTTTYVGSTYTPTATGGGSGNAVTFSIDSQTTDFGTATQACSIANGVVSLNSVGYCYIDANQAGNDSYNAALQVPQAFYIPASAPAQTITITSTPPTNAVVGGTYDLIAHSSSGNGVAVSVDSTSVGCRTSSFTYTYENAGYFQTDATIQFTGVGTCVLDANAAATGTLPAAPQEQQSFAIGPVPSAQTITFPTPTGVTYGDADSGLGATASSGLTVTYTSKTTSVCTIAYNGDLHVVAAGSCTIDADQAGNSTYDAAAEVAKTFTIAQKTVHINATAASKTYGTADPSVASNYVLQSSDFVSPDMAATVVSGAASCALTAPPVENAGTYSGAISCSKGTLSATNYTFVTGTAAHFTINPATLYVNADDNSKTYGATDPGLTYTLSGFAGTDNSTTAGVTGTASCARATGEAVNTYTITCLPGTLAIASNDPQNYTFAQGTAGRFTIVAPAVSSQTISFTAPSGVTYGDPDLPLGATASSDLTVSYSSETTSVCTIASDGTDLHVLAAGQCTIDANQGGNNSYGAASRVQQTFTIAKKTVHINATADSKTYGATDPSVAADYVLQASDFVSPDTATNVVTGAASCTLAAHSENAGAYTGAITCGAGNLSAANYTFVAGNPADFKINQATVHIDANAAQKTYGAGDPTPTGTLRAADFVNGDTASTSGIAGTAGCTVGSHSQNAGTYPGVITCGAGNLSSTNYTFVAGKAADLTIGQATVHVDANAAQKTYGDSDPTPADTLRVADFKNGDTASTSGITGTAGCTIASHSQNAGTYTGAITCGPNNLSSTNYTFVAGNPADLTIGQATLTVTANSTQITYGDALPSFSYTIGGFKYSDTKQSVVTGSASCGTSRVSGSPPGPVGSYTIACTAGTLSTSANYVLGFKNGTLTIAKKQAILAYNVSNSFFFSTGSSTATTASVTLNATLTPAAGGTADLAKSAPVTFLLFKSTNLTMDPSNPDASCTTNSVSSSGAASCMLPSLGIDNWTVIVKLGTVAAPGNSYFAAPDSDAVVITVYQPTTGMSATGGGFVIDPGYQNLPVAISPKNQHGNFGFNVRYKSGTTPMGQMVYTFRGADGYDYIIKSNSWQSGGLSFATNTASFNGKGNVTVLDPTTGQPVLGLGGGNLTYRVDVTDNGKPSADTYAISVYTATGSLYHQAGTTATQLLLAGGNLAVHTK